MVINRLDTAECGLDWTTATAACANAVLLPTFLKSDYVIVRRRCERTVSRLPLLRNVLAAHRICVAVLGSTIRLLHQNQHLAREAAEGADTPIPNLEGSTEGIPAPCGSLPSRHSLPSRFRHRRFHSFCFHQRFPISYAKTPRTTTAMKMVVDIRNVQVEREPEAGRRPQKVSRSHDKFRASTPNGRQDSETRMGHKAPRPLCPTTRPTYWERRKLPP
jgi:hypothetical protein